MRAAEITIGRDLGPVGRWVRLVLGLLGAILHCFATDPSMQALGTGARVPSLVL